MRVRASKAVAALAAMALVLAACGDDEPEETEEPTEEPAEEEEAEPEEEPAEEPEEEPAEEEEEVEEETEEAAGDGLTIGYILPETGQLAFLGPPMITGIQLAVEQVNEAGGVLGEEVTLLSADEAGDGGIAAEEASRLLAAGVDAIVGAAATGMTLAIIDQVTGAGVVQCSPSNTGPALTDQPDNGGFYFRTAPTDLMQGPALADAILAEGFATAAFAARGDDYGSGLLDATTEAYEAAGGTVTYADTFDAEAATFDSVVEDLVNSGADAYVLITFAEGGQIVQGLLGAGVDPGQMFGADGIAESSFIEEVDPDNPNILDGMTFTAPSRDSTPEFEEAFAAFAPDVEDRLFAPQSFDCGNLITLAAVAAGSTDSAAIRDQMIPVTVGDNVCTNFAECVEFLEAGETIAYQSATGDGPAFNIVREGSGEPSRALYDISRWVDGEFTVIDQRSATID